MAITKTKFTNYTRCNRYIALEKIKESVLTNEINYEEYQKEMDESRLTAIIETMINEDAEGNQIDLTEIDDQTLEAMMKYYKQVEVEACKLVDKIFPGETKHALNTKNQESYDYNHNGLRYICFLDIINENKDSINIIEVKATTSRGFIESLMAGARGETKYPIFTEVNNVMCLKDEVGYDLENEIPLDDYTEKRLKLFDRYGIGKYVYDLAVQRMIIEGEYVETNQTHKIEKTKYYLAVLNHEYIFNGKMHNNEPVYETDDFGNEIIRIFDLTKITEEFQPIIKAEQEKLERNIFNPNPKKVDLGEYCQYKKRGECKYFKTTCAADVPEKNSVLNYAGRFVLTDELGNKYERLDLINSGYINLLDVPESWIKSRKHQIQRDVVRSHKTFINKNKIKLTIDQLKYPLYHLDFETFPCPFPRFKGEKCYEQSPFEFSLHIEHEPGVCDKDTDNYVYLNKTHEDEREEIAKKLCELIDPDKGMMFAQNVSFEIGVLKKLAKQFSEYSEHLLKIADNSFDLINIVRGSKTFYEKNNLAVDDLDGFNYYHQDLNGSFSIKKTLPVFTNLSYKDLIVKNGNEAFVTYLNYPNYSEEEYNIKYQALVDYCKQDTWAMVEILDALRKLVK